MRNKTRLKYNAYVETIAGLSGIQSAAVEFTVEPSVQQTLETKIQASVEFLTKINVHEVVDQEGEKIGIGVDRPTASRTDTSQREREPVDPARLTANRYRCEKTNYDTALPYARLDAWAAHPDFQIRVRDSITRRQGLDRILIGFNGTHVAAQTNFQQYPLLQDVNKGWLQQYRDHAPERVMREGVEDSGKIIIGRGGDYENLDAMVNDGEENLIDEWHVDGADLVAICGRGVLHDKYFPILNQHNENSEKLAGQILVSQKTIGGRPAVRVPGFPRNTILVTAFSNLSIYVQKGSRRRAIIDNPKRDRVENFESSNDAFVVEDFGCGCLFENIEFKDNDA